MYKEYVHLESRTKPHAKMRQARDIVSESKGLDQTRALAQEYVDKAIQSIAAFPESDAKNGLIEMCTKVMKRRK